MLSSMPASAGRSRISGLTLVRRKWSGQEVPRAPRRGCSGGFEELQDDGVVAEVAHLRLVRGGQAADHGCQRCGLGTALCLRQWLHSRGSSGPKGSALPFSLMYFSACSMIHSEFCLRFFAGGRPRR